MPSPFDTMPNSLPAHRPDQILIQFADGATAADHSHALQAIGGMLNAVIAPGDDSSGDLSRATLGQGMTVEKAMEILSHLPGVKFAEPDYLVGGQSVSDDTAVMAGSSLPTPMQHVTAGQTGW